MEALCLQSSAVRWVEYTDQHYAVYPPADKSVVKFGVCVEDFECGQMGPFTPKVRRGDGTEEKAKVVHFYAWAGWVPEELEDVFAEVNGFGDDFDFD